MLAAALLISCATIGPSIAQADFLQRLQRDRLGVVQDGTYDAGDNISFTLDRDGSYYLMRFTGRREVFVLYPQNASLGGRILKYDSGKTALQITGWGAMTLYTDAKPSGLPVMRTGDSTAPVMALASLDDVKVAAAAEAQKLAADRQLPLTFEAQWNELASDPASRAECLDALENAASGIDRFARAPAAQRAIAAQIRTVRVVPGATPTLQRKDHDLVVTYVTASGFAGRASSRAIARALHLIFHLKGDD
ncbi:MAG: DUF4908 domain-containing protein [Alphaproteobacteria bacterium]|nr:DUF4908 domain-containing protein [Alphaproteobacteria bacterium]